MTILTTTSAFAHHSGAEFDRERVIVIQGMSRNSDGEIHMYTSWSKTCSHPDNGERTIQGHSIGKRHGDTLVIDTTLFADHRAPVPNTGIPSGVAKHVVERLTLSDDGTTVQVDLLLEDPEYLPEPMTSTVVWHHTPHLEMLRVDCDPDVARQFLQ